MSLIEDIKECNFLAYELNQALSSCEKAMDKIDKEIASAFRKDYKAQKKNKGV